MATKDKGDSFANWIYTKHPNSHSDAWSRAISICFMAVMHRRLHWSCILQVDLVVLTDSLAADQ